MAVDTRDKRMSIMGVSLSWRGIFPLADGAIGAADRQIFPYFYSGILADAPAAVSAVLGIIGAGTGYISCAYEER